LCGEDDEVKSLYLNCEIVACWLKPRLYFGEVSISSTQKVGELWDTTNDDRKASVYQMFTAVPYLGSIVVLNFITVKYSLHHSSKTTTALK